MAGGAISSGIDAGRRAAVAAGWRLRSWSYVDLAPDYRASVVLLGSARSGTTWVGEVIDRHHDHRVVFEPLRPGRVPEVRAFANGQYLRRDDQDPRYLEPMTTILTGRLRNPWADHLNHVVVARRRLVKEIRANLLVPWLVERFPELPVVLLVRHPLAVAESRRQLGWTDHLADALAQPQLVADHLSGQADQLAALTDPFARAVAQAGVETIVPLRMTRPEEILTVTYEALVHTPRPTAERVLRHVGQVPDAALDAALDRPSRLSRDTSAVRTGGDRAAAWLADVGPDDRARADEVLRTLGLDAVYSVDDPDPDLDALAALHAAQYPSV
jgi:Sulfotransferase family